MVSLPGRRSGTALVVKNAPINEAATSGRTKMIQGDYTRMERKMEEKDEYTIWVIRWIDPYGLECKGGTRKEVEAYAEKKAKETGNTCVIA